MISLKTKFKNMISSLADVIKDYPFTMAMILIAALFVALELHVGYQDKMREPFERIMQYAFCMAAQCFVFEEIFRKKLIPRIGSFVFAALFSFTFVYLASYKEETLFGLSSRMIGDIWAKIWVVYGIIIFSLAIFHIFRRLSEDFESYCTRSFLVLLRSYVLYGIFAAGLAVILYIFNELIISTGDLLECSEAFLATGFITAMTIRALTVRHEKPGRFAKICVMYALLPLLLIAYAIIYMYMIKIFVTDDVPSNSVFSILTGLFALGVPIWTMAHDIGEDGNIMKKISVFVPYVYIPFIFLQCWSLGIRIRQYGLTTQRYSGIVLIVFEVIYFVLYLIGQLKKKDIIFMLLFAFIIIAPICAFVPRISFDDAVIRSQLKRAKDILALEKIDAHDGRELSSAYNEIRNLSYKGEKTAEKSFSEKELSIINEHRKNDTEAYSRRVYMRDDCRIDELDITEYKRIHETGYISWEYGDIKDRPYEVCILSADDGNENHEYYINLQKLAEYAVSEYDAGHEYDFSLGKYRFLKINNDCDLFIKEITVIYDETEPEKMEINLNGYVLER
ncbi:MAG: DUF4153 domain-containing protein [Lachnospiraceae bacterium]|nr:DUF4153 domain-containing protein [Lachnospiraceae bacterium]